MGSSFVEWNEQYVSKEKGNRVVHYFLKESTGESILAVVGTERSVRHMFYVVSEELLNFVGADNPIGAGYRWRSRREVVNWLTSMLSKQHRQGDRTSPKLVDPVTGVSPRQTHIPDYKGRLARNLKGLTSDIVWSGVPWTCGKQLKHYPAFCRTGITIMIQSFVFVMAEEDDRHLAYLEDMYEDRKGQKKVKVRWFHHNQEVQGVISLRNPHPKEVFITPYTQVISVECIDGPAMVLTREHYEKCLAIFPHSLLARVHLCFRQFKSNHVKPFKLSKLHGYFDQPVFSCLDPDFFEDREFSPGENIKTGAKRSRSCRSSQMIPYEPSIQKLKYGVPRRRVGPRKYAEYHHHPQWSPLYKANEKIEFLCQDSGIRGCWFRCTVLQVSKRLIRVQYDDVKDGDGCGNLEEWILAFRLAMPDKLGMRCKGRPTIRPADHPNETKAAFEVGTAVDAWWSDGWWEGVVIGIGNYEDGDFQIYVPGENLVLNLHVKNLRVSRDWVGDKWVDIKRNPDILSALSTPENKLPEAFTVIKEVKSDEFPLSYDEATHNAKPKIAEEKLDFAGLAFSDVPQKDMDHVKELNPRLMKDEDNENIGTCDDFCEKENVICIQENDGDGNDKDEDDEVNGSADELETEELPREELIECDDTRGLRIAFSATASLTVPAIDMRCGI